MRERPMFRQWQDRAGRHSLLLALLSWLGLGALTPLCGQAPTKAPAGGAPSEDQDAPTDRPLAGAEIRGVLVRLDAHFGKHDLDAYLATFAPDHPGAHAMRRRQLEGLFAGGSQLSRTSVLVTEPRRVGARTVVRVQHEVHRANTAGTTPTANATSFREDTILALHRVANGDVVPTFEVEIPGKVACIRDDFFRCPPCNYQIGGASGWLCVPMRNDRAQSIEAASFYLIGTDLACDISVQVDPESPTAKHVAHLLGEALCSLDPTAIAAPVAAWEPAAHAGTLPSSFTGARVEITLPNDFPTAGGGRALFHVATFGGLQHLLLARGSEASLQKHAASLQALLDTYKLLNLDADKAMAAAQPLQHHTGGWLQGSVYHNDQWSLELTGPADWVPQQRCGGAAFRVVWSSASGSRMYLTGYRVPAGISQWCNETADRWLRQLCKSAALELPPPDRTTGWTEDATCGGRKRSIVCTKATTAPAGAPTHRLIHLHLRDDLLLVADGHAANEHEEAALRKALQSLRRR